MENKVAPLPGSFMALSIIGFFISAILVYKRYPSWGFAFCAVFAVLFISSLISMAKSPTEAMIAMDQRPKRVLLSKKKPASSAKPKKAKPNSKKARAKSRKSKARQKK